MKVLLVLLIFSLTIIGLNAQPYTQSWVANLLGGPPLDIAVDNLGNVYVTGRSYNFPPAAFKTVKYNSAGAQQWVAVYGDSLGGENGGGIALDPFGNVYVIGTADSRVKIVKYNNSGVQQWAADAWNGATSNWYMVFINVDAAGNVYAAGTRDTSVNSNMNYIVQKYLTNGSLQWSSMYDYGTRDVVYGLDVDATGNSYITGWSEYNGGNNESATTIKYNAAGVQQWVARYVANRPFNEAFAIVVDRLGFVHVTGEGYGGGSNIADVFTIKYSPTGAPIWTQIYDGPSSKHDGGYDIAIDRNNYVYVVAKSENDSSRYDMATIAYSPNGAQLWVQRYPTRQNLAYSQHPWITTDVFGNIFVTGSLRTIAYDVFDFVTLKYNSNGYQKWAAIYNNTSNTSDIPRAITTDANGNVYVTGSSDSSWGTCFRTIKYRDNTSTHATFYKNNVNKPITDLSLTYDSLFTFSGMNMSPFYVNDISLTIDTILHTRDSDLEISLIHQSVTDTAVYQVGGTGANFIGTILDDSASTPIANGTAPFTGTFRPTKPLSQLLNTDPDGVWILRVYDKATGNTGILKAWSLTLMVSQTPIGISQINTEVPDGFKLFQNYPNPFNPKTVIKFQVSSLSSVKLIVFDILGREVTTLVNKQLKPGTYEVDMDGSNFSSGVYFYKLVVGDPSLSSGQGFSETKKMVLIK